MKKAWKALAALTVATALVVAPLVSAGAIADETPPPDDTAVVEEAAPTEVVAEPPAPVTDPAPVTPVADPPAAPEPAVPPAPAQPAAQPLTVPQQGYVLALWQADNGTTPWPQHLVGSVKTLSQLLSALDGLALDCGSFYQADLYADDATTAALLAGGVLNSPNSPPESWPGGYYKSWFSKQWTTKECPPEPIEVTATYEYTPPSCDAAGSLSFGEVEGVVWSAVLNDDGTSTFTASAQTGFVLTAPVSFTALNDLDQLTGEQCSPPPQVYPLPAQFSADPEPGGCDVAGSFSTTFLGEPVTDDGEGTTTYVFENVDVTVVRTDDGVFLKVTAHPGYVLDALDEDKWDVSGDGLFAERFITLDPATDTQSTDPEAPCFVPLAAPIVLGQPVLNDECGTANDGADLPPAQEGVSYAWQDESDDSNWNIIATVDEGLVVSDASDGWASNGDGTFIYEWSPTFSDAACGTTPPPSNTPGKPTGSLAATGSDTNYLPWAGGAIAAMFAGISMMAFRKALRR